jgi:D-3-phosphoglycerate dehydrogenase / 2-oxoglutarate reductase
MPLAVITDSSFPDMEPERAAMTAAGCRFAGNHQTPAADLPALVADADVVITQFARLDATVVDAMKKARAIVRYGIGVDNVDLEAAKAKGIAVCNVPDYCIDEVADQALASILDTTRRLSRCSAVIKGGEWRLPVAIGEMRALRDTVVGVVGFGRIGRAVIQRLRAFGGTVLVHDPFAKEADIVAAGCAPRALPALLAESDLVTLHCPSSATTRKLINAASIATMKRGALLVNVGRGDLVDTDALVAALQSGRLGAAALDVCDPEPVPAGHPLLALPNLTITPHVASCSPRAVQALRDGVIARALRAVRGEALVDVVNGVPAQAARKAAP